MQKALALAAALAALLLAAFLVLRPGQPALAGAGTYRGSTPAAGFPAGLDWINTGGQAVSLDELQGRVVLLDFWTYGCVNCMHVIPDLKKLKKKYGNALVVIGVHSAKFAREGRTENIRQIALRYGRDEPIVNDRNMQIWNAYGVRAWPTLVLIDPQGRVIGKVAGEGHYRLLDQYIGGAIETFARDGGIKRTPLPFEQGPEMPDTRLLFPGKVLADGKTDRLFIADSNHNRIVVTDLSGTVRRVIGSGAAGLRDGSCRAAQFDQPQGMSLADGDTLYVADTFNSAIRRVNLKTCQVETLAGTGEQQYLRQDEYAAAGQPLNTPWDVLWHAGKLYIAMAGQHQIWTWDPATKALAVYAGNRREALEDGPRLQASFNQPSGLATDGKVLYVADAEASAIRAIDFADGRVETLVGTGLFDFGDRDGTGNEVLLQHPLGVVWTGSLLYLADTYNNKLKTLDPETRRVSTVSGGFDEPGGLATADGKVYIADTNHHAIKVYDLQRGTVTTLQLHDPDGRL